MWCTSGFKLLEDVSSSLLELLFHLSVDISGISGILPGLVLLVLELLCSLGIGSGLLLGSDGVESSLDVSGCGVVSGDFIFEFINCTFHSFKVSVSFKVSCISGLPGGESGLSGSELCLEAIGNLLGSFNLDLLLVVLSLLSILGLLELLLLISGGLCLNNSVECFLSSSFLCFQSLNLCLPTGNPAGELLYVLLAGLWVFKSGSVLLNGLVNFPDLVSGLVEGTLCDVVLCSECFSLFSLSPGLLVSCLFVSSRFVVLLINCV
jgi:hypothetical protein